MVVSRGRESPRRSPRALPVRVRRLRCTRGSLTYGQEPDYALLRGLVRNRMVREGWPRSWVYDWMNPSMLPKAILLYEASTVILDYVEENEYNAHLM